MPKISGLTNANKPLTANLLDWLEVNTPDRILLKYVYYRIHEFISDETTGDEVADREKEEDETQSSEGTTADQAEPFWPPMMGAPMPPNAYPMGPDPWRLHQPMGRNLKTSMSKDNNFVFDMNEPIEFIYQGLLYHVISTQL